MFFFVLEFLGEFLVKLYFLGFYFDEENSLVKENPLFYFLSPFYFEESKFWDSSSKNGWEQICYKVNL